MTGRWSSKSSTGLPAPDQKMRRIQWMAEGEMLAQSSLLGSPSLNIIYSCLRASHEGLLILYLPCDPSAFTKQRSSPRYFSVPPFSLWLRRPTLKDTQSLLCMSLNSGKMRLRSLLIPAVLAPLAICQPTDDLLQLEIQRRGCEGSEVENPACRRELFQVSPSFFLWSLWRRNRKLKGPGPIKPMCLR